MASILLLRKDIDLYGEGNTLVAKDEEDTFENVSETRGSGVGTK